MNQLKIWDSQKRECLIIESASSPAHVTWEGVVYHAAPAFPGFYCLPLESAFLELASFFYQNLSLKNDAVENSSARSFANLYKNVTTSFPSTLDNFLHPKTDILTLHQDKIELLRDFSYRFFLHQNLSKKIDKIQPKAILEVGSGTGENLLFIKNKYPHIQVMGWEESQNACLSTLSAAAHYKLDLKANQGDATAEISITEPIDLLMTHIALSVSPEVAQGFLQNIFALKPRFILFYEPFPELWPMGQPRTWASLLYHKHAGYAFGTLHALAKKSDYVIREARRLGTSWNPLQEPGAVLLERKSA